MVKESNMDIKEKIDEKRQQLSYKVQAKIKEYLHIQGIGRRTNGITEELTFREMDVFTMSLWDEIVPLIEKLIKEIELECEARLKEQSVIHSMQLEQVRKETAEQIFKELEKRFGLFVDRKLEKLVIDDSNYYSIGKMEWYKAIKSKYGITE